MLPQQNYITQPEFDSAITAFSGHVDHTINLAKADIRREIIASEDRIEARMDSFEARMEALESRMDRIEARMEALESRMDRIEARMEALESRMDRLEARMDSFEARLDRVEARLDRVENMGKLNHQMLQLVLDQLSKINQKLGID